MRVGRDGFLRLRFARSGDRTILAQSRFSLPLQALTPLTLADGASYLMLLNPTGGVLGGDHLVTEIIQKEKMHSDVLYDFVLTKDENYALTCSLDKTINLVNILNILKKSNYLNINSFLYKNFKL